MTPEQIAELEADRSAIFAVLRRHAIGDDGFAEIAAITHQRITALKAHSAPAVSQPGEDVVQRVARVLAPHVCRPMHNGDCDDVAAGQAHARYVARAAIAAMQESRDGHD